MTAVLVGVLMLIGSAFVLLAAVGILRLPDVFTRMHAATKPATLGIGLIIIAVAVHFGDLAIATRALLVGAFFVLTVPVGAHMIGRAAYLIGTPLWEGSVIDEWQARARGRPDAAAPAAGADGETAM
jgi:multicomponent Na+:H+ antiporter subunit G